MHHYKKPTYTKTPQQQQNKPNQTPQTPSSKKKKQNHKQQNPKQSRTGILWYTGT